MAQVHVIESQFEPVMITSEDLYVACRCRDLTVKDSTLNGHLLLDKAYLENATLNNVSVKGDEVVLQGCSIGRGSHAIAFGPLFPTGLLGPNDFTITAEPDTLNEILVKDLNITGSELSDFQVRTNSLVAFQCDFKSDPQDDDFRHISIDQGGWFSHSALSATRLYLRYGRLKNCVLHRVTIHKSLDLSLSPSSQKGLEIHNCTGDHLTVRFEGAVTLTFGNFNSLSFLSQTDESLCIQNSSIGVLLLKQRSLDLINSQVSYLEIPERSTLTMTWSTATIGLSIGSTLQGVIRNSMVGWIRKGVIKGLQVQDTVFTNTPGGGCVWKACNFENIVSVEPFRECHFFQCSFNQQVHPLKFLNCTFESCRFNQKDMFQGQPSIDPLWIEVEPS